MPNNGTMPPIEAWQAESLRFTAFPSEIVSTEQLSWWETSVALPPEAVVSRPKTGQYQAYGDIEGRRLTLQIQPGRIEWSVKPIVKADDEQLDVPMLGPFTEVLGSLSKVVSSWLAQAPALNRLAFGAVLSQSVENPRQGLLLLQKYLPSVTIDPDGSSDLFYQINRPRLSLRVDGLRMNRLSKWVLQVAQRVTLVLGAPNETVQRASDFEASCKLELDMNTAPDFGRALPAEHLGALLQETIDLGREIAQKGDVR